MNTRRLEDEVDGYRRTGRNRELDAPYKHLNAILKYWAMKPSLYVGNEDWLKAIDEITRNEGWQSNVTMAIEDLIKDVFDGKGFHDFSLLAGNVELIDMQAIQAARANFSQPSRPYPPPIKDIFRPSFKQRDGRPKLLYRPLLHIPHGHNAALLTIPTNHWSDPVGTAFTSMLNTVCDGQFFAALRTKQQLGYAVQSRSSDIHGHYHMAFLVQTEKLNGTATLSRIEEWVSSWVVDGLGEADEYIEIDGEEETRTPFGDHFEQIKSALIEEYESKYPSLSAKTSRQVSNLLWSPENMKLDQERTDALKAMTRQDFRELLNKYFGAKEDWRAVIVEGMEGLTAEEVSLEGWSVIDYADLDGGK